MDDKSKKYMEDLLQILKPTPNMSIAEWADTYRVLSKESAAESGKWNTDRTPYMREIFNCVTDYETEKITIMSAAQVGKSELLMNILGRYAHIDPCPILFVQPTVDAAKAFSKERIEPMIRDTKVLRELIAKSNPREQGTVQGKMFPGGYVRFVGANSPTGLSSRPVRITLADEVDRFPQSAGQEGDPVQLLERRTTTYFNRKNIRVSTPTDDATSKIQKLYLDSSQETWNLPCPVCGQYNELKWENVKYDDADSEPLLECEYCHARNSEAEWKKEKQLNGKWIAKFPEEKKNRGFHLNALASPWRSWKSILHEYLEVKNDDLRYRAFVNTVLGETFILNLSDVLDYESIYDTREDYGAEVPENVKVLTAGVDVQDNRLEIEVVGWGKGYESYGIAYREFPGDPGEEDVWKMLDAFLQKKFYMADRKRYFKVATCFIDSGGHHTGSVYKYVYGKEQRGVYAIKGIGRWGVNILNGFRKTITRTKTNRNSPQGNIPSINLLSLGVNALKDLTYSRLKILNGPGKCHFPRSTTAGYGIDYFKGLTSEVKVKKSTSKGIKIEWQIIESRRNEPLDIRNYATAAVELLPIDLNNINDKESAAENEK